MMRQAFSLNPLRSRGHRAPLALICNAFLLAIFLPLPAAADDDYLGEEDPKKLALVIGNECYMNLAPIASSRLDAERVTNSLRELGFEVDVYTDVKTLREFEYEIIPRFAAKVKEGDFVIFYFSGHGFSHGPHNFLAPTEIPLSMKESEVTRQAISVEAFEDYLVGLSPGLLMFFIDACRSIPGFIVDDSRGGNAIRKGYSLPVQYNKGVNSFIAYATRPGMTSIGSSEPGRLSVFTQSFVDHIGKEGLPFGTVFDELSARVKVSTELEQSPGLYDWSETDPYLKPTARNLQEQKEYWHGVLQGGEFSEIQVFYFRYSVSRHSAAARRWLAKNRDNFQASRFTLASPLAIDRAWRPANESRVSVRRLAIPFAFERSLEESQEQALQGLSDPEIGLVASGTPRQKIAALATGEEYFKRDDLAYLPNPSAFRNSVGFSLMNIDAHEIVVATQNLLARMKPSPSASVAERIPYGTRLKISDIVFGPDNDIWLEAALSEKGLPSYIKIEPAGTPQPLELGQSIMEIIVAPRPGGIPELVDPAPLEKALDDLKAQGWKITWISLSTSAAYNNQ